MTSVSDDSDAFSETINGVSIHSFDDALTIDADSSYTLRFTLFNTDSDITKYISISNVGITGNHEGSISYAKSTITLDPEKSDNIEFTIHIDKYADAGDHGRVSE